MPTEYYNQSSTTKTLLPIIKTKGHIMHYLESIMPAVLPNLTKNIYIYIYIIKFIYNYLYRFSLFWKFYNNILFKITHYLRFVHLFNTFYLKHVWYSFILLIHLAGLCTKMLYIIQIQIIYTIFCISLYVPPIATCHVLILLLYK